ncbi:MAG TPA: alkaline phosphatase family protein [Gemmatimonadaceae bacterium]|jgi:predicted AlkP superfamily pyrophosphatase or phosphodiesterase|nr:alkaline phosphatase family protein [Gemmatimonadaceae bacterium]
MRPHHLAAIALALFASPLATQRAAPAQRHPSLVVLVAIDQMRADYLDRFGAQFTGGLARLRRDGAVYMGGLQDHATTETAPGHSTMLSGREPVHTGIVLNDLGVPDPSVSIIGSPHAMGASPARFRGTTLADWLIARDTGTRILSVSRKDRGAILPIGRERGDVYWFVSGKFTTSTYYADSLPSWVRAYDARPGIGALAGTSWTLLRPAADYSEPDSEPWEHDGTDVAFPHRLPTTADSIASRITSYPWMDSLTLDFALEGARQLKLGERTSTDLLVISLSTTDAVGHAYGPDSREIHDQLLRVDQWLGWFFDSLATRVPRDRMVVALTGDHGVTSIPEYTVAVRHRPAGRVSLDDVARRLNDALTARYHVDFGVRFSGGLLLADVAALRSRGVNVDSLSDAIASEVRRRTGIAHAYTPRSLRAASASDAAAVRWRRTLPADFPWLVCSAVSPEWVWSNGKSLGADHGQMNAEDLNVPIVFMGPGITPRRVDRPVRTVDIAPTLAAYLGVRPSEPLDGTVLREVIRPASNATTVGVAPR